MKRIPVILMSFMCVCAAANSYAAGDRESVPKVRYIEPKDESVASITEDDTVLFSWKRNPMPGGGRKYFKFNIYKEFGYEVVVSEILDHQMTSYEVPRDTFEKGVTYTWQVKQRDQRTSNWSMDYRWSFVVE